VTTNGNGFNTRCQTKASERGRSTEQLRQPIVRGSNLLGWHAQVHHGPI